MQNDNAISVEHLSKRYMIGGKQHQWSIRDTVEEFLRHPFGIGTNKHDKEEFWALNDISFEIKKGDVVGIIGRNGSGKSTLLKILARIVEPTKGMITMRGRVASLLEVGTGFNPELTGRENIYLNGAILGMSQKEIAGKFDEIVTFSGVEQFIDTPVKRYSSGMYVRLAFAVAAHLDSDILLVDEVLAVGDAEFQKKCLGKMGSLAKSGKTVLFVSHDMRAIKQMCDQSIYLRNGIITQYGRTDRVINNYLKNSITGNASIDPHSIIKNLPEDRTFKLNSVKIVQNGAEILNEAENGKPISVEIAYSIKHPVNNFRVYLDIYDEDGDLLIRSFHDETDKREGKSTLPGDYVSILVLPKDVFAAKKYDFSIKATIYNERSCLQDQVHFLIEFINTGLYNLSYPMDPCRSKLAYHLPWNNKKIQ